LGPPALLSIASTNSGLPDNNRPIYNYAMRGVVTSFYGFYVSADEKIKIISMRFFLFNNQWFHVEIPSGCAIY
jgi:hypothetical protein